MSKKIDVTAVNEVFRAYRHDMNQLNDKIGALVSQMEARDREFHQRAIDLLASTEWMSSPKVGDILVEIGWQTRMKMSRRRDPPLAVFVVCRVSFFPRRRISHGRFFSPGTYSRSMEDFARDIIMKDITAYAVKMNGCIGKREGGSWRAREVVGRVKTKVGENGQPFVDTSTPVVIEFIDKDVAKLLPAWARSNA